MTISVFQIDVPAALNVRVTGETLAVDLSDGRSISVPLTWFPRLAHASEEERNHWRLVGQGQGIHWEDLDEDISVEGILAGRPSGESQASFVRWLKRREWVSDIIPAARRILSLPEGWDGRGGSPPSAELVTQVLESLQRVGTETLPVPNVVPVPGGGIQLEWNLVERELEVEFKPGGDAEYLKTSVASDETSEGAFQASDLRVLRDLLKWLESGQ